MRDEADMTILEHLEEFRSMILRCCLAIFMGMLAAGLYTKEILFFLEKPLFSLGVDVDSFLIVPQVMGSFKVAVAIIFWSGLVIAAPFITFFLAQFIFPGLHDHEKRVIRRFSWCSVFLFFGGAALGYTTTIEVALDNLLFKLPEFLGKSVEFIFLSDYIMFVLKLVLGFGLAFQLPLVVLMLGYADLIGTHTLKNNRRQVLVGLLVMAMLLTPPEPVSQVIMAFTLYLLYEVCIFLIWLHERSSS